MSIVDDLLAQPGLYVGVDVAPGTEHRGLARMVVSPLPGGAGVAVDYEVLDAGDPDRARVHAEHTLVARASDGRAVMVVALVHAPSITVLDETQPGVFEPSGPEAAAFPMKVVVSVPAPGRIRHAWWYGRPGAAPEERDVADLRRVD
jgi:hypothetical protein